MTNHLQPVLSELRLIKSCLLILPITSRVTLSVGGCQYPPSGCMCTNYHDGVVDMEDTTINKWILRPNVAKVPFLSALLDYDQGVDPWNKSSLRSKSKRSSWSQKNAHFIPKQPHTLIWLSPPRHQHGPSKSTSHAGLAHAPRRQGCTSVPVFCKFLPPVYSRVLARRQSPHAADPQGSHIRLDPEAQHSLDILKTAFTTAPILMYFYSDQAVVI